MIETINGSETTTLAAPLDLTRIRSVDAADRELHKRSAELARLENDDDPTAYAMSLGQREQLARDIAAIGALRGKLIAAEPQRLADEEEFARLLEIADARDAAEEAARERRVVEACRVLSTVIGEMEADAAKRNGAARSARVVARRLGRENEVAVVSRSTVMEQQQIARAIGADARARGQEAVRLSHRLAEFVVPDFAVPRYRTNEEQLGAPPRTGDTASSKTPHAPWPDPREVPIAVYPPGAKPTALQQERVVVGGREIVEEIG
jgi:hypothetical protein